MAANEINLSGNDMVTVSFDKEGYSSQAFKLNAENIEIKGAPSAFITEIDESKLPEVNIIGPEDIIETLTEADIHATVILSDIKGTGSFSKEANVYVEGQNMVWCCGTNEVQVNVSIPKTEENDSSESDSSEE